MSANDPDADDVDFTNLTVVRALPSGWHYPEKEADLLSSMIGAEIIQIGRPEEEGVEGGGLVIDYIQKVQTKCRRVVFAFNERGMWVEFNEEIPIQV
jgi:hypothetical protein